MLTFRNTNIFFASALLIVIGLHLQYGMPWFVYLLLFIAWSLLVFWGCYYIGSGFFIKIVCKADTAKKEIAISFDDGPAAGYTKEILRVLKDENVKASFFCIGNRIASNEELLKQVHEEGHIIGNHSHSHHFWFDMYTAGKMQADLAQMDAVVQQVIGLKPKLFRPPYGVTNPNVKQAIVNGGYTPIGWSVRSMDTVINDEKKLLDKISRAITPGAVFLFHDTSKTTFHVLPAFIKEVKKRGYVITPLDKLLDLQPYE
jgi:peptidoglycan-N-acetylglucosamine deacetylase